MSRLFLVFAGSVLAVFITVMSLVGAVLANGLMQFTWMAVCSLGVVVSSVAIAALLGEAHE